MELRQLTTFQLLAQTLSFSHTAVSLNYAQSTISAQIQALEKELGVFLFDRMGKQVVLTEPGQQLLAYANQMLQLAGEAKTKLVTADQPSGTLTISTPETLSCYRLPGMLHHFCTQYPEVQLIFVPRPAGNLGQALSQGIMDIAFVIDQPIQDDCLIIESLVTETLCLITYPQHPLAQQTFVIYDDLAEQPFLLTETGCSYRGLFERTLLNAGVQLKTTMEFHSVEAIKQCVMAGVGLCLLPAVTVAEQVSNGRLIPLNWQGNHLAMQTQMMWHKDKWLSPAMQAFIATARSTMNDVAALSHS
jgi:DNA-binding transcriptional LysR family regulator